MRIRYTKDHVAQAAGPSGIVTREIAAGTVEDVADAYAAVLLAGEVAEPAGDERAVKAAGEIAAKSRRKKAQA